MDQEQQKPRKLKQLHSDAKLDTQVAAGMVTAGLISDEGIQAMQQVLQGANDPAQAIAHVIFMAMSKVREKLIQNKIPVDPKVWIAGGGVLDRVIFEVMGVLFAVMQFKDASNSQFVHSVKEAVLDLMQDEQDSMESGQPQEPDNDQDDMSQQQQMGQMPPQGMMVPQGVN